MTNARGNRYSRNHTRLNPNKDAKFWNFGFHEIGTYDLPAIVDFILHLTKKSYIYYVGQTQSTSAMYVMLSELPQYNKKIKIYTHLAPAVYMSHMKSPFYRAIAFVLKTIGVRIILKSVSVFL